MSPAWGCVEFLVGQGTTSLPHWRQALPLWKCWCYLWQDHPSRALRSLAGLLWKQLPPMSWAQSQGHISDISQWLSVSVTEKVLEVVF